MCHSYSDLNFGVTFFGTQCSFSMIDSEMVVCRWLAVIRYMELMNVLHHRRQYMMEPVSSRFVSVYVSLLT